MKEALKLALEALNDIIPANANIEEMRDIQRKASAALREALAQPEQKRPPNCGTGYCSCIECVMEPSPVALQMDVIVVNLVREGINKHRARELAEHFIKNTTPPQRTWVGLTDEDWAYMRTNCGSIRSAVETAEAKLKEKNT